MSPLEPLTDLDAIVRPDRDRDVGHDRLTAVRIPLIVDVAEARGAAPDLAHLLVVLLDVAERVTHGDESAPQPRFGLHDAENRRPRRADLHDVTVTQMEFVEVVGMHE